MASAYQKQAPRGIALAFPDGWRVLVVEGAAAIGGAARTAEVTLPGFRHDLCATNLSTFAASPAYRENQADFDAAGLRFLSNGFPYATAYPDGTAARVYSDPDLTDHEMAAFSPADREGWRQVASLFRRTAPHVLPLSFTAFPSMDMVGQLFRLLAANPRDALWLARIGRQTPRQFVDRFFDSDAVKGLFLPWAFHMDFGPDVRGGATFAFVAAMSAHLRGLILAQGGTGRIAEVLGALLERHGGTILTGTEVTGVRIEGGRAIGVETARGDVIHRLPGGDSQRHAEPPVRLSGA